LRPGRNHAQQMLDQAAQSAKQAIDDTNKAPSRR
jgi:hypothetical protein